MFWLVSSAEISLSRLNTKGSVGTWSQKPRQVNPHLDWIIVCGSLSGILNRPMYKQITRKNEALVWRKNQDESWPKTYKMYKYFHMRASYSILVHLKCHHPVNARSSAPQISFLRTPLVFSFRPQNFSSSYHRTMNKGTLFKTASVFPARFPPPVSNKVTNGQYSLFPPQTT